MDKKTKKKNKLEVLFVGGGIKSAIGMSHYLAIALEERISLVGGAFSLDQQENLDTASRYDVSPENVYSDWKEMVSELAGKAQALVVLTPTPDHYTIVEVSQSWSRCYM